MLIFLDGPEIINFQPDEAIAYWDSHPTSRSKTGAVRAKRPVYGDSEHKKPGPKPKLQKKVISL